VAPAFVGSFTAVYRSATVLTKMVELCAANATGAVELNALATTIIDSSRFGRVSNVRRNFFGPCDLLGPVSGRTLSVVILKGFKDWLKKVENREMLGG
jgi:hypothetical protein